ncbi:helix-turn-helix transcriptional regulator [Pelagibacterium lentulum]
MPKQIKMARAALGIGVRDLARMAGVSSNTISRLERGEELKADTVATIRTALELAGVQFLDEGATASGLGVALKGES